MKIANERHKVGPREQTVRRIANDVVDELGICDVPVVPDAVARAKAIRLEEHRSPPEVYGALYLDGAGFGIVVSTACHGPGHRAFTIAHELGHYHIDGHVEAMFPDGQHQQVFSSAGHFRSRRDPREREADWFAAELLMPERWAGPRCRPLAPTVAAIQHLATDFGVSLPCAGVRYTELSEEPVALVLSQDGQIEWLAFSQRMSDHGWSRRSWKRELVPTHSATRRLARDRAHVERGDTDEASGLLCEWFDGAPTAVTLEEEALGLGRYGRVLTVLSAPGLRTEEEIMEELEQREWREHSDWDALRGYTLD